MRADPTTIVGTPALCVTRSGRRLHYNAARDASLELVVADRHSVHGHGRHLYQAELRAENGVMSWKDELVESVWQHARVMPEADPSVWRQDACGAWILRDQFGHEHSEFGWKIENVSGGGPEVPENLRPFNVRNGFDVASKQPHCQTTADRAGVPAGEYVSPPRNRGV